MKLMVCCILSPICHRTLHKICSLNLFKFINAIFINHLNNLTFWGIIYCNSEWITFNFNSVKNFKFKTLDMQKYFFNHHYPGVLFTVAFFLISFKLQWSKLFVLNWNFQYGLVVKDLLSSTSLFSIIQQASSEHQLLTWGDED